ncbi:MAG: glycosyltransferase family 4 protein [Candidatus Kapabacteria bacterium]|nr:glycosyltransferase family 4 protein [Candidatus Kapabacteria bacterium]
MRIIIFNWQDRTHPQAGGAETHLHEIFGRLVKKGHDVTLVACHFPGSEREETVDGIRVVRIGNRSTYNFAVPFWWLRHGKRARYDLVVDDINKIPLLTPLYVNRPVLALVHHLFGSAIFAEAGLMAGSYVWLAERLIPIVYRRSPTVVVSNSTRSECIQSGLRDENISVVYNGVDTAQFPMAVGIKAPVPTVSYFGRLKRYKSVDHVIRAFAIALKDVPNARLEILGRGDDESRLRSIVTELGLKNSVTFHGYVDDRRKVELLSWTHAVVNPSKKEGWGITNIEANACGTPVISADSPGLRDSVSNDVSGFLYPYGDIEVLARKIVTILTDTNLRTTLSEGAVRWARQFSWDQSAQQMEHICQRIIGR